MSIKKVVTLHFFTKMKPLAERIKDNERYRAYYANPENDAKRRRAVDKKKQSPEWRDKQRANSAKFKSGFTPEAWREYNQIANQKYYYKTRKKKK